MSPTKLRYIFKIWKKSNQVANAYFGSLCSKINFVIAIELSPETLCDFFAVVSYWCLIDLACNSLFKLPPPTRKKRIQIIALSLNTLIMWKSYQMPIHTVRQRQVFLDKSNGFYGNKWVCSHRHFHHQHRLRHRPQWWNHIFNLSPTLCECALNHNVPSETFPSTDVDPPPSNYRLSQCRASVYSASAQHVMKPKRFFCIMEMNNYRWSPHTTDRVDYSINITFI